MDQSTTELVAEWRAYWQSHNETKLVAFMDQVAAHIGGLRSVIRDYNPDDAVLDDEKTTL